MSLGMGKPGLHLGMGRPGLHLDMERRECSARGLVVGADGVAVRLLRSRRVCALLGGPGLSEGRR